MFPNMSVLGIQLSCMEKINELTKCNKLYIYIFSLSKKEILTFTTPWMNLEDTILSEISQAQKDKYCMISLTDTCEIENNQTCRSRE